MRYSEESKNAKPALLQSSTYGKVRIKKIRSLKNYTAGGHIITWVLEDEDGKFVMECGSENEALEMARAINEEDGGNE